MPLFRFTDNLDTVDHTPIQVLASINVIPSEKGGRQGPFTTGFRPNHNFGEPTDTFFFIGQIEIEEGDWVYPCETRELVVTFLNVRGLVELLVPGRIWRIQEGPRLVALGTVKKILGKKAGEP